MAKDSVFYEATKIGMRFVGLFRSYNDIRSHAPKAIANVATCRNKKGHGRAYIYDNTLKRWLLLNKEENNKPKEN